VALRLTQAVDYAVRAMVYISSFPEGRWVLRAEIAQAEEIPYSFTAKILRSLVHGGLLRSSRGAHGGFALSRAASEISLREVYEAIEGRISLAQDPDAACTHSSGPAHAVWHDIESRIVETLDAVSVESLASAPRRAGVLVFRPRGSTLTADCA